MNMARMSSRASSCRRWAHLNNLIYQGVPARFPKLRWSFVESTSQWLPYAVNDLVIRTQAEREFQRKYAGHVLTQARPKESKPLTPPPCCATTVSTSPAKPPTTSPTWSTASAKITSPSAPTTATPTIPTTSKRSKPWRHGGKIGASLSQKILDDNPRRLYGL